MISFLYFILYSKESRQARTTSYKDHHNNIITQVDFDWNSFERTQEQHRSRVMKINWDVQDYNEFGEVSEGSVSEEIVSEEVVSENAGTRPTVCIHLDLVVEIITSSSLLLQGTYGSLKKKRVNFVQLNVNCSMTIRRRIFSVESVA